MDYLEYNFKVFPVQPGSDILIAELGEIGFESFVETEDGVLAYIPEGDLEESRFSEVQILDSDLFDITFSYQLIQQVNWNEEWEKNFDPILIDKICEVRAPFHPKTGVKYDIVIEPKMSFGTGHHETTSMMIQHLLKTELNGKEVLDMGCGTAVLAILAEMRGASKIHAIDNDPWCVENSLENIQRNGCSRTTVELGDASNLNGRKYDMIIANINRNILLQDIKSYSECLNENAQLLLSGFYSEDVAAIENECNAHMLKLSETMIKNNWVSLKFIN